MSSSLILGSVLCLLLAGHVNGSSKSLKRSKSFDDAGDNYRYNGRIGGGINGLPERSRGDTYSVSRDDARALRDNARAMRDNARAMRDNARALRDNYNVRIDGGINGLPGRSRGDTYNGSTTKLPTATTVFPMTRSTTLDSATRSKSAEVKKSANQVGANGSTGSAPRIGFGDGAPGGTGRGAQIGQIGARRRAVSLPPNTYFWSGKQVTKSEFCQKAFASDGGQCPSWIDTTSGARIEKTLNGPLKIKGSEGAKGKDADDSGDGAPGGTGYAPRIGAPDRGAQIQTRRRANSLPPNTYFLGTDQVTKEAFCKEMYKDKGGQCPSWFDSSDGARFVRSPEGHLSVTTSNGADA